MRPATAVFLAGLAVCRTGETRASSCEQAAQLAEQHNGLPTGLLEAIGHVESGHSADAAWSVNQNDGRPGRQFHSADSAESSVAGLIVAGNHLIDVGCFQVDLFYHPLAFARWQDAFDPDRNAEAAAHILQQLHQKTNDWQQAVALYHSADPARGQPYLRSFMQTWTRSPQIGVTSATEIPLADPYRPISSSWTTPIRVWSPRQQGPALSARLPRIQTP
jgi:hypothetical protein